MILTGDFFPFITISLGSLVNLDQKEYKVKNHYRIFFFAVKLCNKTKLN